MNGATHRIEWLDDGRILLLELAGFWDGAVAEAFERDTRARLAVASGGTFHAVCDASTMTVQSADTQRRIQQLLDEMRAAGMAGGAMVVTSALLRLQAMRTVDRDRTTFFDTRAAALAWARARIMDERPPRGSGTPDAGGPAPAGKG